MGERKGTNKYYPPDFDPKKHRSLDAYHGTHPLRERAKKIKEGILVIRFEMPYNIWCGGCENPIGMGVRYNAEKSKVGMYYTTPIYQFRMKCHLCDMYFVIKTDPANHDYVIVEGARRKEQRWDPKENEQIVTEDKNDVKKRALDAMYKLEHGVNDKSGQKKELPGIAEIEDRQSLWKEDYLLNKALRAKFRGEKKAQAETVAVDTDLLHRSSLDIKLVKESERDKQLAGLLKYTVTKSFDERQEEERAAIASRPILGGPSTSSLPSSAVGKAAKAAVGKQRNSPFSNISKPQTASMSAAKLGIVSKNKKTVKNSITKEFTVLDADAEVVLRNKKDSGDKMIDDREVDGIDQLVDKNLTDKHNVVAPSLHNTSGLSSLCANYDSSSSQGSESDD